MLQRQKCCHSAAFFEYASDTENHAEDIRDTDKQKNDIKADVIANRDSEDVREWQEEKAGHLKLFL